MSAVGRLGNLDIDRLMGGGEAEVGGLDRPRRHGKREVVGEGGRQDHLEAGQIGRLKDPVAAVVARPGREGHPGGDLADHHGKVFGTVEIDEVGGDIQGYQCRLR